MSAATGPQSLLACIQSTRIGALSFNNPAVGTALGDDPVAAALTTLHKAASALDLRISIGLSPLSSTSLQASTAERLVPR